MTPEDEEILAETFRKVFAKTRAEAEDVETLRFALAAAEQRIEDLHAAQALTLRERDEAEARCLQAKLERDAARRDLHAARGAQSGEHIIAREERDKLAAELREEREDHAAAADRLRRAETAEAAAGDLPDHLPKVTPFRSRSPRFFLTTDVARFLRLSSMRVTQLAAELGGERTPSGRLVFERAKVEAFAAARARGGRR